MMKVEQQTGQLFGGLWDRYDDTLFKESVALFEQRWIANGEPRDFFVGKRCLDAGCGGGRYSFAMARLGARSVVGVDVGEAGLEDAQRRRQKLDAATIEFRPASVLELPFADGEFDFVCCSGVLHHTRSVERGLREISRVLKPGGSLYLLLYGSGGLYWPLNLVLRPFAAALGQAEVDRCIAAAGLGANKRRTILDDLFVPILETYTRERVDALLAEAGFRDTRRWQGAQLDHEADPLALVSELQMRELVWKKGAATTEDRAQRDLEERLAEICRGVVGAAEVLIAEHQHGALTRDELRAAIIGHGHHRLITQKP